MPLVTLREQSVLSTGQLFTQTRPELTTRASANAYMQQMTTHVINYNMIIIIDTVFILIECKLKKKNNNYNFNL